MPYEEIYARLASGASKERNAKGKTARNGIHTSRKWFKDFMTAIGFVWIPTMSIGSGCKVHLTDGELPMGRLVVSVSRHLVAVIDGVIHDTYNPERNLHEIGVKDGVSYSTIRRRCVYGYWTLKN